MQDPHTSRLSPDFARCCWKAYYLMQAGHCNIIDAVGKIRVETSGASYLTQPKFDRCECLGDGNVIPDFTVDPARKSVNHIWKYPPLSVGDFLILDLTSDPKIGLNEPHLSHSIPAVSVLSS